MEIINIIANNLTIAKRKASKHFNNTNKPVNEFIYNDCKFTRINKIYPNGIFIYGVWK